MSDYAPWASRFAASGPQSTSCNLQSAVCKCQTLGMCGPNGFSAVLVINRVSTLATVVLNRVWVLYSSLELDNVV